MERTIIAAFLDNSHTITENHLISALSSVNNVMATAHKRNGEKSKPFVITAVIACLAVLAGFLGADKIFNLKNEQPAAQIAANTYNQQPVETRTQVPVQKEQAQAPDIETNTAPAQNDINTGVNTDVYNMTEVAENNTVAAEPEVNNIPQVEEQMVIEEPAPVVSKTQDVYILANSLNVRAIPSLESARVAAAKVGQRYEYVSENEDWVQIRISPILTGWVFKQYVSISERP